MQIFAPEREYEAPPVRCVIEIQGRTHGAVFTEYHRHSSHFDEKMNTIKNKMIIKKFDLDNPVICHGIYETILFYGREINCYWCNNGKTLIEMQDIELDTVKYKIV